MVYHQKPSKTVVNIVDNGHHFAWVSIHVYSKYTKNSLILHLDYPIIIITGNVFSLVSVGSRSSSKSDVIRIKKGF